MMSSLNTSSLNSISTFITPLPALGTFLHRRRLFVQLEHSKTCTEGSWKHWAQSSKAAAPQNVPAPTAHCCTGLWEHPPASGVLWLQHLHKDNLRSFKVYWAPACSSIPTLSFPGFYCAKDLHLAGGAWGWMSWAQAGLCFLSKPGFFSLMKRRSGIHFKPDNCICSIQGCLLAHWPRQQAGRQATGQGGQGCSSLLSLLNGIQPFSRIPTHVCPQTCHSPACFCHSFLWSLTTFGLEA